MPRQEVASQLKCTDRVHATGMVTMTTRLCCHPLSVGVECIKYTANLLGVRRDAGTA